MKLYRYKTESKGCVMEGVATVSKKEFRKSLPENVKLVIFEEVKRK